MKKLIAENLLKKYGERTVVKDVSFEVSTGQIVGLLGPNGAGKTTSFYMVVGMIVPDRGRVLLQGEDISKLPMYRRARMGLGYLPQEASIFRKLTVEENILAVLENREQLDVPKEEKLSQLIKEFSLEHVRKQKSFTLSGGERRRLEVARALALDPTFILLDEPFAGVDPLAVQDIQNLVRNLKNKGLGILITDHNVRETLGICDFGYILSDGMILEYGTPAQIAESPRAREAYLGENFKL